MAQVYAKTAKFGSGILGLAVSAGALCGVAAMASGLASGTGVSSEPQAISNTQKMAANAFTGDDMFSSNHHLSSEAEVYPNPGDSWPG